MGINLKASKHKLLRFYWHDWVIIFSLPIIVETIYLFALWVYLDDLVAFKGGDHNMIDAYYAFSISKSIPLTLIIPGSIILVLMKRDLLIFRNLLLGCLLAKTILWLEKIEYSLVNLVWEFLDGRQAVLLAWIFTIISAIILFLFSKHQRENAH